MNKLTLGAKAISTKLTKLLTKEKVTFNEISWKNGKEHYILTVKTDFGTRFARFSEVSLLEQKDPMTIEVNDFQIRKLTQKLMALRDSKK